MDKNYEMERLTQTTHVPYQLKGLKHGVLLTTKMSTTIVRGFQMRWNHVKTFRLEPGNNTHHQTTCRLKIIGIIIFKWTKLTLNNA